MDIDSYIESTDIYKKCLLIFKDKDIKEIKTYVLTLLLELEEEYENNINNNEVDDEEDDINKHYDFIDEDYKI